MEQGTNFQAAVDSTLTAEFTGPDGLMTKGFCTGVPPTTADRFAHGCIMTRTDSGTGNKAVYENVGSSASPSWNLLGDITAGEITLAQGSILVGNASGVATALDAKTSGRVLVGNGTTTVLVAISGDATLASSGALTVTGATAAFNLGTNMTMAKEVNHTVTVTATTTADTIGGSLAIASGAGFGTGNGGLVSLTGGQGGATGVGGAASLVGGAGGATSGQGGAANLTGGAGTAGNANGGDVVISGGAPHGTGSPGVVFVRSFAVQSQGDATAKTTSATLTGEELTAGIITVNQGAGGTSDLQLPTASDMDTFFSNFTTNDSIDVSFINISTVDAEDASVTTNTGWTLVGSMDFPAYSAAGSLNSSGILRLRKTGSAAWTAYRIS